MKRLAVACLALCLGAAWGQDFTATSQFSGSVSQIEVARANASSVITNASNSAKAVGRVDFLGPGGRQASAQLEAQISRRGVLTAAAKGVARASGWGAAAVLGYELYQHYRVRSAAEGGAAGLMQDPGKAPLVEPWESFRVECFGSEATGACSWHTSIGEALAAHQNGAQVVTGPPGSGVQCTSGLSSSAGAVNFTPGQASGTVVFQRTGASAHYYGGWYSASGWGCQAVTGEVALTIYRTMVDQELCPAYIDWQGGLIPKGVGQKGLDGKCPTGSYTKPLTAEQASGLVGEQSIPDLAALFRESIGFAAGDIPADALKKVDQVTPQVVEGATTTTTNPDGTTTEVKTEFEPAPIAGFNTSRFQAVPWWEKKTTVTKDAQGVPISTTTSTTKPAVDPATGAAVPDGTDPCIGDPGRLGCIGLGAIPDEPALPTRAIAASAEPDSGWGAFNASCPTPPSFETFGHTVAIDNTLFCSFLGGIRFIIIAFAGLAAIRVLFGGLQS